MSLFSKREVVFQAKDKARHQQCKAALTAHCIPIIESGSYEDEMPVGGCGAKLDVRDFGPGGRIDRRVYYLAVRPEDAPRARALIRAL